MITAGRTGGIKNASAAYAPPYVQLKNGVVLGTTGDPNASDGQEKTCAGGVNVGCHFRGWSFSVFIFGACFRDAVFG